MKGHPKPCNVCPGPEIRNPEPETRSPKPETLVHRVSSSLLGPVDPSCRALSGRLKFTVRRHKLNKDYLSVQLSQSDWLPEEERANHSRGPKPENPTPEPRNPKLEARSPGFRDSQGFAFRVSGSNPTLRAAVTIGLGARRGGRILPREGPPPNFLTS